MGYISVENGTLNIVSGGDGFQAETHVLITGGSFNITSGGGSSVASTASAKGIKGISGVTIDGGDFVIDSADDAIHSDSCVIFN
jgi:hypothetical protein